ncbi:MAG: hypothetical protein QXV17_07340 [Candidatus Micrarchaeaceae archaeon]
MMFLQLKADIFVYIHFEQLGISRPLEEILPLLSEGNREDIKEEIIA